MMVLGGAPAKRESTVAVIDIGSSSVGGALVRMPAAPAKEKAQIIASVRVDMSLGDRVNFERFTKSMYAALDEVLAQLAKEGKRSISSVLCSLASPWYLSHTRHERIEHEKPFTFSSSLLEKSINEYRDRLRKRYDGSETHDDGDSPSGAGTVTEVQAISVRLNGYETNRPYGISVSRADIALYASVSQKAMIETLERKITHALHVRHVAFHSFPLIVFAVLRDVFLAKKDFLLLDVSGEVTDIAMIKQGVIEEIVSFPFGKNFIFRRIANMFGVPPAQAAALFDLYRQGKAEKDATKKVLAVLDQAGADWTKEFSRALQSFTSGIALPHHVFFTADSDVGQWFAERIEREEWGQFTIADQQFDVRLIEQAIVDQMVGYAPKVPRDVFLALLGAFTLRIGL
jgi:cell division ATPase FtsA